MAKKSKNKNTSIIRNFKRRHLTITMTLLIIVLIMFISLGVGRYYEDQSSKRKLDIAKKELDRLAYYGKSNNIEAHRSEECARDVQKSGEGKLYCFQELEVTSKRNDDVELQNIVNKFNDVYIRRASEFSNIENIKITELRGQNIYGKTADFSIEKSNEEIPCRMSYAIYDSSHRNKDLHGQFEVSIRCFTSVNKPIY